MVQMIGIDHERAALAERELFSFHAHEAKEAMQVLKDTMDIGGCVLISTCNRTELYVTAETPVEDLFGNLCQIKNLAPLKYVHLVTCREAEDAVHHLFEVACGMKSKVFGEDQIITQVKTALEQARDAGTTDTVLEKVFQSVITAAKQIKTQIHLTAVKTSVIENMIAVLQKEPVTLSQCNCLVIGNGEIGYLAAERLLQEGAKVTMTIRRYRTRKVPVPEGCARIDYQDRYVQMGQYDIIVSSTASPHHTVKYEDTHTFFEDGRKRIFIDLAVPRDISSRYADVANITLYNIDTLGGAAKTGKDNAAVEQALQIIAEYEKELREWNAFRSYVPDIQTIGHLGGVLTWRRMNKKVKKEVSPELQKEWEKEVARATEKTITALLFGLRDKLEQEQWQPCIEALEQIMIEKIGKES